MFIEINTNLINYFIQLVLPVKSVNSIPLRRNWNAAKC